MGEEDRLRIVECLRGRLLAERLASRNAKETAEQTENKLVGLEAKLKVEIKTRKKAEKRLKLLVTKLQMLKISNNSYDLDESVQSWSFESEVTSVSSSASCTSKKTEDKKAMTQSPISSISSDTQDLIKNMKLVSVVSEEVSLSRISFFSKGHESIGDEEISRSFGEDNSSETSHISKADHQSLISSNEERNENGEDNEEPKTDWNVHDETVKEGHDSLRHANETNQILMEQRRMVRVG